MPNKSSQSRRPYRLRYACNAIDSARSSGIKAMSAVFNGITKPAKKQDFRRLNMTDKLFLKRYYLIAVKEEMLLKSFREELLGDSSDEDKEARLDAFLRIPTHELKLLRKLKPGKRIAKISELTEFYGEQSKGNGCGHNKDRFTLDLKHLSPYDMRQKKDTYGKGKRRPEIIYRLIDQFIFMALIPDGNKSLFFRRTERFVEANNGLYRLIRSEGREGMVKLMVTLLLNWDPRSMRIGVPLDYDKTSFAGLSITTLAKRSGLSFSRTKRALRRLEEQDFLHKTYDEIYDKDGKKIKLSKQRREKQEDGSWRGFTVVRVLKVKLFNSLSLDKRAHTERAKSTHKVSKGAERQVPSGELAGITSASDAQRVLANCL